ncbi:sigma factor-like helix-turn-helix DNA-binding protein [Bacteroides caecimuris]|nr:sigma factor-like helix-turn-helix DNA-binding protein [Bacteroides caecimuris]
MENRDVFRRSRYESKSIKEIADTLNISVKSVLLGF